MPTSELRRQRGVPSNSRKLPIVFFASLSRCHCSGSLSLRNTRMASSAGSAPTMNMMRQELAMAPDCSNRPSTMPVNAAVMLPTAESACSSPSA